MIEFNNIHQEFYIILLILAFFIFLLSNIQTNQLIIIIIILIISYAFYFYLSDISANINKNQSNIKNQVDSDVKDRKELVSKDWTIREFPKKLKYLKQNEELMNIITNIRFIQKFCKSRYGDILVNMNNLMKTYIYILNGRYTTYHYIPQFSDIRDNIIELMYSLFIVIPDRLKHTYGLDVYTELYKSIEDFTILSRNMLEILQKFALIHNKDLYIPDQKFKPYNSIQSISFP